MSHALRVLEGRSLKLARIDARGGTKLGKQRGLALTEKLGRELGELDDLLYYAGQHGLLIVLQGMDCAGKDGTIRHLLNCVNVQSARVKPFKVPTPEELAHDFLWRVHEHVPGRGSIAIFNRSHYEDVLVVRVHGLVPEPVWRKRYAQIRAFEELLAESGTIILKFFLHVDRDEQHERLLEREQDVTKSWKLSVGDWKERERWDAYQEAYEAALSETSTKHAPWYVVPANRKWLRNLAVTERIVATLRPFRKTWLEKLESVGRKAKAELEAYRGRA